MNLRFMLIIPTVCTILLGTPCRSDAGPSAPFSRIGVNLAGGEFTGSQSDFSNHKPGRYNKDYIYSDQKTMKYFSSHGLTLFRIPFRWERIQPRLGKPLNSEELKRLKDVVASAAASNAQVILDLHNYACYRTKNRGKIVSRIVGDKSKLGHPVTIDDLCDVWQRLAKEFCDDPTVVGYGIMNEPHDMPANGPSWHAISRVVVRAIRAVDADTTILVSGDQWSSAKRFPEANGPVPWIEPKIPNIVYEAHVYFDRDGSGKYRLDYKQALSEDPQLLRRAVDHVQPFLDWCKKNKVQGFIGEFGTPPDPGWLAVLNDFLNTIGKEGVGGCYWAAGSWWDDYPLSIQPKEGASGDAPQMKVIKKAIKR